MMDFTYEDHQLDLQQAARRLFAERCPTTVVREVEGGPVGYLPDLWRELADLGWVGLAFPAGYGGSDGRFLDLLPLYEEMGRFLVPSPHLDTVGVAADVILSAGSEAQKQRVLPAIAAGRCLISVATIEPTGVFEPTGIMASSEQQDDRFLISGTKLLVGLAAAADYFLVTARTAERGPGDGVTLFLVDAKATGITSTPIRNIAGAALSELAFDQVEVSTTDVIGEVHEGWPVFSRSATKAAVLQTASIIGGARAVLDMTNQYAKDREQFGKPIGAYQAVQYMVSDILIAMHSADLLVRQAAYRIDAGLPFEREAAMAIAYGKKAAAHLHRQAHEVHAGMGFMLEHDLQLFSRRSKFWENNLGDARHYQEELADVLRL